MSAKLNVHEAAAAVDQIGRIKAEIADLKARREALQGLLIESGYGHLEGDLFRAAIFTQTRAQTNWKLVAERSGASRQLIRAHTREITFPVVNVTARKED